MRKLIDVTSIAIAVLLVVAGLIGAFTKNVEVSSLIIFWLIVLAFTAMCYSGSECDACKKKDCVCDKPEKPEPKKEEC